MSQTKDTKFPVGGYKDDVFAFLQKHGFVMSEWSDKHWTRSDGLKLHIYGTGSMARIYRNDKLIADGLIEETVRENKQVEETGKDQNTPIQG